MAQYIDKSALVAWIENQIDSLERNSGCSGIFGETQMAVYDKLYSFLNTLEVKEVDLEKEFDSFLNDIEGVPPMWHSEEQIEWGKDIARHFFELGLKAQKGE